VFRTPWGTSYPADVNLLSTLIQFTQTLKLAFMITEVSYLLGYNTMQPGESQPKFQRNIWPPSSGCNCKPSRKQSEPLLFGPLICANERRCGDLIAYNAVSTSDYVAMSRTALMPIQPSLQSARPTDKVTESRSCSTSSAVVKKVGFYLYSQIDRFMHYTGVHKILFTLLFLRNLSRKYFYIWGGRKH
jgi:hypothetical protein